MAELDVRSNEMTTIARFSKPEEAHLLRTRLEAGGIAAYVQDEHMVQMDWLYSNAIRGVRVQVADDDLDGAYSILEEPPINSAESDEGECPKCQSTSIFRQNISRRLSYLSILIFWIPLPAVKDSYKCNACGYKWK